MGRLTTNSFQVPNGANEFFEVYGDTNQVIFRYRNADGSYNEALALESNGRLRLNGTYFDQKNVANFSQARFCGYTNCKCNCNCTSDCQCQCGDT